MNKPAKEMLERIQPLFDAAVARERRRQEQFKREVRGE